MKKVFAGCLTGLLLLFCSVTIAYAQEQEKYTIRETELYAQAAVLMEAESGRVLYAKNAELQLAMASTTKIMTCIVALECADTEEIVTVSSYAASQPKVKLYLNQGEQVVLGDLLYSLMLESHNDTAVAIAEHIGAEMLGLENDQESVKKRTFSESEEAVGAFIRYMNEKAKMLQCYHTWFITPNGLDATETFFSKEGVEEERFHSTTAKELARMMSYCVLQSPKKEEFLNITGTYSYDFTNVEKTRSFVCNNHNAFLNMMDGAVSGKTGYTGRAGYCYVGALECNGTMYVVALLNTGAYGGQNKTNKWKDAKKLMQFGTAYFKRRTIYEGTDDLEQVLVENGYKTSKAFWEEQYVSTAVSHDTEISLVMAEWEQTEIKKQQQTTLQAPVYEGQVIGQIEVCLEGVLVERFDIVCTQTIREQTFYDIWKYVWDICLGTVALPI